MSGCPNAIRSSPTSINPAWTAGVSTSSVNGVSASTLAAASTSVTSARSVSAATSNAARVVSGRSATRALNVRSSRVLSGSHVGSSGSCSARVEDASSSTSPSGFPCACSRMRARVAGARSPSSPCRSASAASLLSGASVRDGRPRSARGIVSREVTRIVIASASIRRATNASTSVVASSSQCASSATTTTGARSAASPSRFSTAMPVRNGSFGGSADSPIAASNAARWGAGSPSASSSTGHSSGCSDVYGTSVSDGIPVVVSTVAPAAPARLIVAAAIALLPTPGSPCSSSASPGFASSASTSASSSSRPTSIDVSPGRLNRPNPRAPEVKEGWPPRWSGAAAGEERRRGRQGEEGTARAFVLLARRWSASVGHILREIAGGFPRSAG